MKSSIGRLTSTVCLATLAFACAATAEPVKNPERDAFFGDTHAHSQWSTDSFGFGNRLDPENAYRFARGEKAYHVDKSGEEIQLKVPLDFFRVMPKSW